MGLRREASARVLSIAIHLPGKFGRESRSAQASRGVPNLIFAKKWQGPGTHRAAGWTSFSVSQAASSARIVR